MVAEVSTVLDTLARERHVAAPAPAAALATMVGHAQRSAAPGEDTLAYRRRAAAARTVAQLALDLAASTHGAFGDRPDGAVARATGLEIVRFTAARPGPTLDDALEELRLCVEGLAELPDEPDWQLAAIAYADEAELRRLHERCLTLSAAAVRRAAA